MTPADRARWSRAVAARALLTAFAIAVCVGCAGGSPGPNSTGDQMALSALAKCGPELQEAFERWRQTRASAQDRPLFVSSRWVHGVRRVVAVDVESGLALRWSARGADTASEFDVRDWERCPELLGVASATALRLLGDFRERLVSERRSAVSRGSQTSGGVGSHSSFPDWWRMELGPDGGSCAADRFVDVQTRDDGVERPEDRVGRAVASVLSDLDDPSAQCSRVATPSVAEAQLIDSVRKLLVDAK